MKRMIAMVLCLLSFISTIVQTSAARAQTISLAELKQQTPERLQMTVTTDAGEIVTVDAPIVLPEGDVMPMVVVKRATFNTLDLFEVFPLPKDRDRYFYGAVAYDVGEICDHLSMYVEEKQNKIYGKTDYSTRYALPKGSAPPENPVTPEEIMGLIQENIQRFHCDTSLDIRMEEAVAMSGLCTMKKQKVTDGNGVSWIEIVADPEKPLKKGTMGTWSLNLAQYMHGVKIVDTYRPYGSYQTPTNSNDWYSPVFLYAVYLDEHNMNIGISAVKEVQVLEADQALLSYNDVVRRLEERIKEGKLKSIYGLRLAYSVRIAKGDAFRAEEGVGFSLDTRFVLVPEWQILGFDEKDASTAKSVGYDQPSKEAILDPESHSRYALPYELRMDASTGKFILDYESMEFALNE